MTRFKEAQQIIDTACQGKVVNLDTSFRSTGQVLELANFLFSRLFASAEKPWEFGYELVNCSDTRRDHAGFVELMLVAKEDTGPATKRAEATMVARRVQSLVVRSPADRVRGTSGPFVCKAARPVRGHRDPSRTAHEPFVLPCGALPSTASLYYVHGGTGFYGRQEIFDLLQHPFLPFEPAR